MSVKRSTIEAGVDPVVVLFAGMLGLVPALGAWESRRPRHRRPEYPGQQDYAAQAEIEEHDIEQMLDSYNALRRRTGGRELGDELAHQLEGHLRDG
jgi:hypothetical protein